MQLAVTQTTTYKPSSSRLLSPTNWLTVIPDFCATNSSKQLKGKEGIIKICSSDNRPLTLCQTPENTTSDAASLQPYDPIFPMLKLLIIKLHAQLLNICHLEMGSINPFQAKPCLRTFNFSFFYREEESNFVHTSFRKPFV